MEAEASEEQCQEKHETLTKTVHCFRTAGVVGVRVRMTVLDCLHGFRVTPGILPFEIISFNTGALTG